MTGSWIRRGLAAAALLGLVDCRKPQFDALGIDIATNCTEVTIRPAFADLLAGPTLGGDPVLGALVDLANEGDGWLMLRSHNPSGFADIVVVRVHGGAEVARAYLQAVPNDTDEFDLRAAATPTEVWVTQRSPGHTLLWRVDLGSTQPEVLWPMPYYDVAQTFPTHDQFPNIDDLCSAADPLDDTCPTSWPHELVFAGGVPYLVAIPTNGLPLDNGNHDDTYVYVDALDFYQFSELKFLRECPSSGDCAQNDGISYPAITLEGSQIDPRLPDHCLFMLRNVLDMGIPLPAPELVVVRIGIDEKGNPKGVLRSGEAPGDIPVIGPPSGLARDQRWTYVLHATLSGIPSLMRLGGQPEAFEAVNVPPDMLHSDSSLVQLDGDIALARIDDNGALALTKLFPDAPDQSTESTWQAPAPIASFEAAGPGALLLHHTDGGASAIRIACVSPDGGTGTGTGTGT